MGQTADKRRSAESIAFERYLRTGIRLSARAGTIEVKFNPWHDPANGRFTFGGQGRYFGNGSSAAGQARGGRRQSRQEAAGDPDYSRFDPHDPRNRTIYTVKRGDSLTTIAKLRNGLTVADLVWLNGIAEDAPLQIGQKLMLPTRRHNAISTTAAMRRTSSSRSISTWKPMAGRCRPTRRIRPRSKLSWMTRGNGIRSRRTDIGMSWISASARARSKGRCQSMRQPNGLGAIRGKPVARIAARLVMAGIISLPASTAPATPSTISHKTPISTAVPTGSWK